MPSVSDRSPSALSTPSPVRRIVSRITSPFSTKSRIIPEFAIEPDHPDPHKQYSPGDVVTGSVRLRLARPTRVTHIVICLHGFVQVFRNPGSPGEGYRANNTHLGSGRGNRSGEYFGNGFASLFEDEVVLCGDGRLAEGAYQFDFELEFPDRDLPSSIDFERGTITYMITATMTRPTTISPISSCDRKIYFVERIDISPLYPPKARTITLEPVSKRSRAKNHARKIVDPSEKKGHNTDSTQHSSDTPQPSEVSSAPSTQNHSRVTVSPAPSEISFDSSQGQASQTEWQRKESPTTSDAEKANNSKASLTSKVITATVESQAGGCLRGDSIPVKVNISHTKHVKSLYGVIVTLYRLARVDVRPSLPIGPTEKGKDVKYEDYYPKSMTGLGGLSLTGAGSSHVFRKDLSQVMSPLYVDPHTLTAELCPKVRVPEEAFPTIATVPGAMISFKYYIEVVVDIQGKLSNQERSLSNLAGQATPTGHQLNFEGSDMDRSAFTPFGSTIVDTAPVRRDKSVVTCTFEVIIGTRDSERRKGKRKMVDGVVELEVEQPQAQAQQESLEQPHTAQGGVDWYDASAYYGHGWYDDQHPYEYPPEPYHAESQEHSYDLPPPPPPVPIPQIPDESQLTEKERIQRAEERLLPSQPPGMDGEEDATTAGATAPYLPDESVDASMPDQYPAVPEYVPPSSVIDENASSVVVDGVDCAQQMPNVPEYSAPQTESAPQAVLVAGDDKQEMQRQQLQAEASAPPLDGDDEAGSSAVQAPMPSAPTLDYAHAPVQDIHDSHADAAGSSELPRYER